jgi:site-specific recombinase XerD
MIGFKPKPAGDNPRALLPREQWETVLAGTASHRDRALLAVLLWSGLRVSECCALEVTDVDFVRNRLRRRGKESPTVFCHPYALEQVRRYLANRVAPHPQEGNPLFVSRQRRRLSPRQVWNVVHNAGKAAGVSMDLHPHRLRCSHGARLLAQSQDPLLVAQQLGYRTPRVVIR